MGYKGTISKNSWTLGELSPRALGRFDADKPIFRDGAATLENMLISQDGGVLFRPGTQYIAGVKNSANKVCLYRFTYSISQEYVLEVGSLYMRFFANSNNVPGQVVVPSAAAWVTLTDYVVGNYVTQTAVIYYCLVAHTAGTFATDLAAGKWVAQTILEIPTIFAQADIFNLQTANKADVMYICNATYYPQKLIRTSATSFTISNVPFVRGPFLDTNITATTITPSADSGAGITLTASTAIFLNGHVGSLWRVKNGVVKITAFSSTTVVTGDVQAEPSGAAGALGTGPGATADWAEGAFSTVRGFPTAVTFHEERIVYGGTTYKPQTLYASQVGAYDNFDVGTTKDHEAWIYEIGSNVVNGIRWLYSSIVGLKVGTSGGTISANDASTAGITPTAPPNIILDTDFGVMAAQPQTVDTFLFYLQANKFNLRQLQPDLILSRDKSIDMQSVADHVLRDGSGAVQMARQQSPNTRLWIIRSDGQIAVLTRNTEQRVTGWCRIIGGQSDSTASCNGFNGGFETIAVLPIDGLDDQVWVVCQRSINGVFQRFVEIFTTELFINYWEPIRMDASLTYDSPITITAIDVTLNPVMVTAPAHGLSNGDQIKINGINGSAQLNDAQFIATNVTTNTFRLGALS